MDPTLGPQPSLLDSPVRPRQNSSLIYAYGQPVTGQLADAIGEFACLVFSERELTFTFPICYRRPSVSSVCLSVTFVRPTQAVQIFGSISTALGTLATR